MWKEFFPSYQELINLRDNRSPALIDFSALKMGSYAFLKNYLALSRCIFLLRFSLLSRFLCHFQRICRFFFHLRDDRFMLGTRKRRF